MAAPICRLVGRLGRVVGERGSPLQHHWHRGIASALVLAFVTGAFLKPSNADSVEPPRAPSMVAANMRPFRSPLIVAYFIDHDLDSWVTLLSQGHRLSWIITTNFSLMDESGVLQGIPEPRVLEIAHGLGGSVHFRVTNFVGGDFSRAVAHIVLTHPPARQRALASILRILDTDNFDGVNLDLENVPPGDRAALTRFTAELSTSVRSRGKTLSIAVPPKTRDQLDSDWSGAFDLAALSRVTDTVIVMAYDQHWSTSAPGPVAALPWVEDVVRFAVREVGPHKLLLGMPFYGYDWRKGGLGKGVSMRDAVSQAAREGVRIRWDERGQVPYYKTAARTVYFENARSIERKLTLATRQGLAGIAAWRLGHELPEVWDVITAYLDPRPGAASAANFNCTFTASKRREMIPPGVPLGHRARYSPMQKMQDALGDMLTADPALELRPSPRALQSCASAEAIDPRDGMQGRATRHLSSVGPSRKN